MFDYPELKQIGRLKVASKIVDPSAPSAIILHGYGANAFDLWSLHTEIQTNQKMNWYFPDGIMGIDMGPGYSGRAWFPINEKALERAMLLGQPLDYSQTYPAGMERARDLILDFIVQQKIEVKNLVLGGFSQGAMLSLEVALHLPEPPKGLMLFSGTLACEKEWKAKAEAMAKKYPVTYFQSHGDSDTVLPFVGAEKLRDCLEGAGWNCRWEEFPGGHEIPRSVLKAASYYLKSR